MLCCAIYFYFIFLFANNSSVLSLFHNSVVAQLYSYYDHTPQNNNSSFVCFLSFRFEQRICRICCVFSDFFAFSRFFVWILYSMNAQFKMLLICYRLYCTHQNELTMRAVHIIFVMTLFSTIDALMCVHCYAVFRCFMSQPAIINNHRCCYRCEKRMKPDYIDQ